MKLVLLVVFAGFSLGFAAYHSAFSELLSLTDVPTKVEVSAAAILPPDFSISPNPLSAGNQMVFSLNEGVLKSRGKVSLTVLDVAGKVIAVFNYSNSMAPRSIVWNIKGVRVPAGIYFARLKTGEITISQKFLILK